jgi:hypothetical protein
MDELFGDLGGNWSRSRKGNLWCSLDGLTVSVFPRGDRWQWCIASAGGPRYSRESYASEAEAAEAAEAEVLEEC